MSYRHVPKVDLHLHIEGTITPAMVKTLAERNHLSLPEGLLQGDNFVWHDDGTAASALTGFVRAYDIAASVIKTADDYRLITHDYLTRAAAEGCIYAEPAISADHATQIGLSFADMVRGIEAGYAAAKKETGIEMRCISTCVRHYGPARALRAAEMTRDNPHPLVTAFGMAGDENAYTPADFAPAFDIAGLPFRTAHAGEAAGPESIRAARDHLKVTRFGHMVRAIEDKDLLSELLAIGAVPEVCVSSNISLKVFTGYDTHPLRKLFDMGFAVTLGSDDPPFFKTTIGREYEIAEKYFGFDEAGLQKLTRNAISAAFVDEATREYLFDRAAGLRAA